MPEENDNEGGLEEGAEEQSYFVDNPSLDLEATSNAYEGLAKLYRLQFIAEHCPCYRVEALKLAITAVQSTYNTTLYQRLHRKLQECIGGTANAGAAGLPDVAVGAADQVFLSYVHLSIKYCYTFGVACPTSKIPNHFSMRNIEFYSACRGWVRRLFRPWT